MESVSSAFLFAVFFLGCSVGALAISLQRQCVIERLKRGFEEQLKAKTDEQAQSTASPEPRLSPLYRATVVSNELQDELLDDSQTGPEWARFPLPNGVHAPTENRV